jgi:hypothetical protein
MDDEFAVAREAGVANGERSGVMENRAELLMRQASMTAYTHMRSAKDDIDAMFGEGYAKQHPELVGAYTQAAAINFAATFQGNQLEEIAGHLEAIFNVAGGVAAKFS